MNNSEFNNVLHIMSLQKHGQIESAAMLQAKEKNLEYRKRLFLDYYKISPQALNELIAIPPKSRKQFCEQANVNRFIVRTLFDYNSYKDCFFIYNELMDKVSFKDLRILDFGCLVSDYGFFFGLHGGFITFCDFEEHTDFAEFRLGRSNIHRRKVNAPVDYKLITKDVDLAIFGEVLEHLFDPYLLLKTCAMNNVKFIYTSCYPYGNDSYFNLPGHSKEAQEQAGQSLELLREGYIEVPFFNFRRLWIKK